MYSAMDDDSFMSITLRGSWSEDDIREFPWILVHPGLQ